MAVQLLTAREVAQMLCVSKQRVYEIAREGLCPAVVRLGRQIRFHPARLDTWLDSGGAALSGGWRHTQTGERGESCSN